jgi:class 3 adenylate cyclase
MGRTMAVVLFTDLVGSTDLRGRLGEEAADELRRRHDQVLCRSVEVHNGRVVKGLGDGIMATFAGASDAVAAAVAIQQAVDQLNRTGKAPVPIEVRVGLSAGDVAFEDEDVHGTPVIEASRLCGAAAGGEIVSSEVVRLLAGADDAHRFAPVGALELKGLVTPVAAYQVAWEPLAAPPLPMPGLLSGAGRIFVGRHDELERLLGLWKEAMAGERRVALAAGEPGIGKTRLAVELAGTVRESGGVVLAGRCDEDLGVPYQPFVEALRHYVLCAAEHRLGRYPGDLARLVPELREIVAGLPEPLRSDAETERYRLFDALAGWLSDVSAEAPVLLVLDDLHWAAKPTLLLLRHILRSSEPLRILVVGTYRDSEIGRGHPLSDLIAELRRDGEVERLVLSGLDTAGVGAFIEAAAGHTLGDEEQELLRVVWRETEGHPFFVVEVLRHLSESGTIEQQDGRWVLRTDVGNLRIPEGVRDVVGRRLSRLAEATNRLLAVAAVVGLEFEGAVVGEAGGDGEEEVLVALEEAIQARLLVEVPGPRYRFSHALVRATLYDELSGARRVALHRRVAQAIEAVHGASLDDHLPALALHWARASAPAADTPRAVDYAARAGDRALTQLAPDEAMTYYRQALELLDLADPDEERRLRLLIALGEAQRQAGDPSHRDTLLAASRLAAERGDASGLARAALLNTRPLFSSAVGEVDDERVAALETALGAVGDSDPPTRSRLLAALGTELVFAGETQRERRMRLAADALTIARRLRDDSTLADVLLQNYYTTCIPETLEGRLADTEELLALAQRLGDPVIAARASYYRARTLGEAGQVEAADPWLVEAERLSEQTGQPTLRWLVGHLRTIRTILAGDLDEAERRAHAGFELGQATGQRDAASFLAAQLFLVRFDQGRLGELEETRLAELAATLPGLPIARALLALLLCERDRPDEAAEHYSFLAADDFSALPKDSAWIVCVALCATVCASLGDRHRAPVLFRLLLPFASQFVLTPGGWLGAVAHHLAVLAATSGDFEEAQPRFAIAATTHERIGAPSWLARTRLEWARMLRARGRPGDADQARRLAEQALDTARQLRFTNIERQAAALLGECS